VVEGELVALAANAARMEPRVCRNEKWTKAHAKIDRLLNMWQRAV
jgi:hypothetical protein